MVGWGLNCGSALFYRCVSRLKQESPGCAAVWHSPPPPEDVNPAQHRIASTNKLETSRAPRRARCASRPQDAARAESMAIAFVTQPYSGDRLGTYYAAWPDSPAPLSARARRATAACRRSTPPTAPKGDDDMMAGSSGVCGRRGGIHEENCQTKSPSVRTRVEALRVPHWQGCTYWKGSAPRKG